MRVAFAALLGITASFVGLSAGHAQKADPYLWCAEYGMGRSDGGTNCYFMTYQQCRDAISGNGGYCRRNLFYTGPASERQTRRHR